MRANEWPGRSRVPGNPLHRRTDDQDVLLGGFSGMPVSNDFFARGGMTFQHGYVDTPICCPSRTSTLSGRYGHNLNQTGLGNWCGQFTGYPLENHTWVTALCVSFLVCQVVCFPSLFALWECSKDAGYVTSMSGKYHNAPPQGYVPKGWVSLRYRASDLRPHYTVTVLAMQDDFFSLNNECQYFNNTFNSNGEWCAVRPRCKPNRRRCLRDVRSATFKFSRGCTGSRPGPLAGSGTAVFNSAFCFKVPGEPRLCCCRHPRRVWLIPNRLHDLFDRQSVPRVSPKCCSGEYASTGRLE